MQVTTLKKSARRCRYDFFLNLRASNHANERISQRLSLGQAEVVNLLNDGRAIVLNNLFSREDQRGYYLFYSKTDKDFFVAVVAVNKPEIGGEVVTVLTRQQFEADLGHEIPVDARKRAAQSNMDARSYEEWRRNLASIPGADPAADRARARIRIRLDYWDEALAKKSLMLGRIPNELGIHVDHELNKIPLQTGFLGWLNEKIKTKGVSECRIADVVAIRGENEYASLGWPLA